MVQWILIGMIYANMKETLNNMFSGRMSRRQFVYGYLYLFLITLVLMAPFAKLIFQSVTNPTAVVLPSGLVLVAMVVLGAIVQILGYGMMVRRLHDIGQTGWWILVSLIPYLSVVFVLVLTLWAGQKEENHYGPVPEPGNGWRRTLLNR